MNQLVTTNTDCDNRRILGVRVDCTDYARAVENILEWSCRQESRYVCAANTHMIMEAHDDPAFKQVLEQADLVTPDGMPLVVALRILGLSGATRVYGPTLALEVCREAAAREIPIGLYGSDPQTLHAAVESLTARFPDLAVACRIAPPFRPLTQAEDDAHIAEIANSGCRILLVGLGCPKQEKWMHAHRNRVPAVMIGIGAAFSHYAGTVPQAPAWLQNACLEWLFRLCMEPRRLWRRYLRHNPRFMLLFIRQCFAYRREQRGHRHGA